MPDGQLDVGIIAEHMSFDEHGGANYSRHRLGEELEARGHNATIYTLNFDDENHIPVPHQYDVVETRIDARTLPGSVTQFFQQISQYVESNDVIHVYVPGIIPLFGLYRRVTGDETPIVATLNGYTPFCTNTARMQNGCWQDCTLTKKIRHAKRGDDSVGGLARMAFNNYAAIPLMNELDQYHCLSPAVRRIYREVGVDDDLLTVAPNMLDPDFTDTNPDPEPQATNNRDDPLVATDGTGETRILYVGRLDAMKSVDDLLDAVAAMQTPPDAYHVDIVGDNILGYGQGLDDYRADADQLGISDQVTFHGWVDYQELSPYYERGDVFVHPGEWPEPFGRTIIEAMSHGLPVVSTRVGAPPWITGSAGVAYPRGDVAALTDTLDGLLAAPERIDAMAANTQLELERFQPDRVMDTILDGYREAMQA